MDGKGKPLLRVTNLGKRYRRGERGASYGTLREALSNLWHGRLRGAAEARREASEFWAVRNLDFDAHAGDVIGIIGRNGAGKSTLLKLLGRITHPSSGRIERRGRIASLLEVGTGFHPELTGRENIFLNGAILGLRRHEVERRFDEIVDFSGVEPFLDTPVKFYSSGMYVRLAFAVAAHLEQEILLVDEVLAVGDMAFQRKCLGRIREASQEEGRCVLFVSHNNAAVASLCTRGIVMHQGRRVFEGTALEALSSYNESLSRSEFLREGTIDTPRILSVSLDEQVLAEGRLRLEVVFASPFPLDPPVVGVTVATAMGNPVFGVNTQMDVAFDATARAEGTIVLSTDALPLVTGSYKVTVWLGDRVQGHDVQHDVLGFDLLTRHSLPPNVSIDVAGPVAVLGSWTIRPEGVPGPRGPLTPGIVTANRAST